MFQIDPLLTEICERHGLHVDCLQKLIESEQQKEGLVRKRGLRDEIWRILEEESCNEESAGDS